MSLIIAPADVVRIARALDVDPYGMTADRLLEEVAARVAKESRADPSAGNASRGARDYQAEAEERELSDLHLAWAGIEPLPGDDGRGRAYLRYEPGEGGRDSPYSPDASGDEEALWRSHAANFGLAEDERL